MLRKAFPSLPHQLFPIKRSFVRKSRNSVDVIIRAKFFLQLTTRLKLNFSNELVNDVIKINNEESAFSTLLLALANAFLLTIMY